MTEDIQTDIAQFPIRELSARTQVNTVTLRAWERRYGLLKPQRTAKGHRLYSEEDVASIEKILALVARGVPIGKVKPLLDGDLDLVPSNDEAQTWQAAIVKFMTAAQSFSSSKVEHLIQEAFSQYPAPICRERLLEPVFSELALATDHGAAFGFAESELIRYVVMRLNAKTAKKKRSVAVTLVAGNQAPLWRMALMAIELTDAELSVQLIYRPFTAAAGIELAGNLIEAYTVFYQDGVWKDKEQKIVTTALQRNERLFMCGTASSLTIKDLPGRVFADVGTCIEGLLALS